MKHLIRIYASCKRSKGEEVVRNGLALTPSNVLKMAEQGIPASANMQYKEIEGPGRLDWSMPLEEKRGVDPGVLWQASRDAKKRMTQAYMSGTPVET